MNANTNMQNALDLPIIDDLLKEQEAESKQAEVLDEENDIELQQLVDVLDSGRMPISVIENQEKQDLEQSLDDIHADVLQNAKDLMDLGYNVDTRSAGRIFDNASNMFKIALDAKVSKRDAQFKLKKLELENRKLDLLERKLNSENNGNKSGVIEDPNAIVEDRNTLMKRLREENKAK